MLSRRLLLMFVALLLLAGAFVSLPRQIVQWQLDEEYVQALNRSDLRAVRELVRRGASVRIRGLGGTTGLMLAARQDDVELARAILDRGADVDARDNAGHTALMVAAGKGGRRVLELLLERGADPEARDQRRLTALDYAREARDPEAIRLLSR